MKEHYKYKTLIPRYIMLDNTLKPSEKILYSEITYFSQENGVSHIDIDILGERYNVSRATVLGWIAALERAGLIDRPYQKNDSNIVDGLKRKDFVGLGIGNKQCKWCKIKTHTLHNHHHPVQKKDGGDKVVAICPNCHHEFHHLKNTIRVKNLKDTKIYKEIN